MVNLKSLNKISVLVILALLTMSERGCDYLRKDYEFATQADIGASPNPSASVEPTLDPDDEDDDDIFDGDEEDDDDILDGDEDEENDDDILDGDEEDDDDVLDGGEEGGTTSLTATRNSRSASNMLETLKEVEEKGRGQIDTKSADSASSNKEASNWLGENYSEKKVPGQDSDFDGYSDVLEEDFGTDANNPNSYPNVRVTSLSNRLSGIDNDVDGLTNDVEMEKGTDPNLADSDGDGYNDGAEVLSNSDPLDAQSVPYDSDGDGLADQYESAIQTDPTSPDSDLDNLRDDLELAIGSNPNEKDTDNDGILDGKEVEIGSDPIIPEFK